MDHILVTRWRLDVVDGGFPLGLPIVSVFCRGALRDA